MYTLLRKLIVLIFPFMLFSCMKEDYDDCGIYLEFIFDYNMEYTNLFRSEIEMVDVYVFDAEGTYLFSRHADCLTELEGGNRMYLEEGFSPGTYQVITVGALSRYFRFTDINQKELRPGITKIEEVELALCHETNDVAEQFPHLWYGKPVEIEFTADLSVYPIHLIRETNHFTIEIEEIGGDRLQRNLTESPYTFDIITPENGVYGYDNGARVHEALTYHPYLLTTGNEPGIVSVAKLMTMRLLEEEKSGYRLVVRNNRTGESTQQYDLMDFLERTKPNRPDSSVMPVQEYLDREWDWYIVIRIGQGGGSGEGFVAVQIIVNGWIVWTRDIEI